MIRDAVPNPLASAAIEAIADPNLDDTDDVEPRQCGRCRMMFKGDPTLDVRAQHEWWLCPSCEAVLLPVRSRHSNVIPFPRRGGTGDEV